MIIEVEKIAAEFTYGPVAPENNGRCYEVACRRVAYGPGERHPFRGHVGAHLVHGTIQAAVGAVPLYHAWVEEPDGQVWEPSTNTVYTARAFAVLFMPVEFVRYDVTETRAITHERNHFGPWIREAWQGDGFNEANGEWEA